MRTAIAASLACCFTFGCDAESGVDAGGEQGRDAAAPAVPVELVRFSASSTAIDPYQQVELEWEVRGARLVEITAGDTTLVSTFEGSGRVTSNRLRDTTTFVLTMRGAETKTASLEVTVRWPEPRILRFDAQTETTLGSFVFLTWSTSGAEYLRLLRDGTLAARFENASLEIGAINVLIDEETTTFVLEAVNPQHTVSQSVTIRAMLPPTVLTFTIEPHVLFSEAVTATITWDTAGAERTDLLEQFGNPVPGFPGTLRGTFLLNLTPPLSTQGYRLLASSAFAITEAFVHVGQPIQEREPNDSRDFANQLFDLSAVSGELSTRDDVDTFAIFAPMGASLRAWVTGVRGEGCDTDTRLVFSNSEGELVEDDSSGPAAPNGGNCALLDPNVAPELRDLFDGQYYLAVHGSERGRYVLAIEFR